MSRDKGKKARNGIKDRNAKIILRCMEVNAQFQYLCLRNPY